MSNRCEYVVKLGINLLIMVILSTIIEWSSVYNWIIFEMKALCIITAWEIIYKDVFKMNNESIVDSA